MAPPLASRYELTRELARGDASVIHEATDRTLGRAVVVKVLEGASLDAAARGRFAREARALADVRSAHVVEILDVVDLDGAPAIVMERLDGVTLAETLRRERPLAPARALRICREMLDALAAAHRAGIVHRDVEPSNVVLVRSAAAEIAKVIDFGLVGEAAPSALTTQGPFHRRPEHAAPEVLAGAPATPASDVYSVGSILFEMVAGAPLHAGDAAEVLAQKLSGAPPPKAGSVAPGLPPDLARLVDALVAPPGARPRDAAAALELFGASADVPPPAEASAVVALRRPEAAGLRRRGVVFAAAIVAGVALAAVAGALGAIATTTRDGGRALAAPDGSDTDSDAPPPAPSAPEAPVATTSSEPAPSGATAASAAAQAARCLCKNAGGLTLCPAPRSPRCVCQRQGPPLCHVPYVADDGKGPMWGYCAPKDMDYSSPTAKTGDSCEGYGQSWHGGELTSTPVPGALVCDTCYPHLVQVPRSTGVHGAPCRGHEGTGFVAEGRFDCR